MCRGKGPHSLREAYGGQTMTKANGDCESRLLAQWNIQASARHPCLLMAIERAVQNIEAYGRAPRQAVQKGLIGHVGTINLAGPVAYTQAMYKCIHVYGGAPELGIRHLPSEIPFIYDLTGRHLRDRGENPNHFSNRKEPMVL